MEPLIDLKKMAREEHEWRTKLTFVYETLRTVRNELEDNKALIGFAGGVWTLVVYMLGGRSAPYGKAAKYMAAHDPQGFNALLGLLGDIIAWHLAEQLRAGADAVQLFDSHAGLLSEREFADWVIEPTQRIVEKLRQSHPQAIIIGFPRGASQAGYQRYAMETGVDAVSLDTATPLSWAVPALGGRVALQGNLDPSVLVAGGPALDAAVDNILEHARNVPFVFNLGHGVLPETPIANVERMLARVRGPA